MTIKEALIKGNELLKDITEASWLDASLLLCHSIGCEKWYLAAHDNEDLVKEKENEYFELVKRRMNGEPLQYITNRQEFMGLPFFVDDSVLIPRADTEILVEEALRFIAEFPVSKEIKVMDMCTGSGCIAISIAKYTKNTWIKALDISKKALEIARKNSAALQVDNRIDFIESDLFNNLGSEHFDMIVSNPPYIPTPVISTLQIEVRKHEPINALDGGEDGLEFYKKIINNAYSYLNPGGALILEIGFDQANEIISILQNTGKFNKIKLLNDFGGRNRVIFAERIN